MNSSHLFPEMCAAAGKKKKKKKKERETQETPGAINATCIQTDTKSVCHPKYKIIVQ